MKKKNHILFIIFTIFLTGMSAYAQEERAISGVVYSKSDNMPLVGVTLLVKGTKKGVISDFDGKFTYLLKASDVSTLFLEVSSLGMKTQTVAVGEKTYFEIYLEDDVAALDEVVVTSSYGTTKKREQIVGSIAKVKVAQLQEAAPVETIDKLLEGYIPGVYVQTNTELGAVASVDIRGPGTLAPLTQFGLSSSSQPLYVIDGVIISENTFSQTDNLLNAETITNPLLGISPEDIENIVVLKDASAAAIYGANASNGVILITTKKGKVGATRYTFKSSTTFSRDINRIKLLNGPQYYALKRELLLNDGASIAEAETEAGSASIDTDWYDLLARTGISSNLSFSASGATETFRYYFSTSYNTIQQIIKGNHLDVVGINLNIDKTISEKLIVGLKVTPSWSKKIAVGGFNTNILAPNEPVYTPEGDFNEVLNIPNPLAILEQNENEKDIFKLNSALNLTYDYNDHLTFSGFFGLDYENSTQLTYLSMNNGTGRNQGGRLRNFDRNKYQWVANGKALYERIFQEDHKLSALMGLEFLQSKTLKNGASATNLIRDDIRVIAPEFTQPDTDQDGDGIPDENDITYDRSSDEVATISWFTQLSYSFADRYHATFNLRRDEVSLFGDDVNAAVNMSLGLGWVISKERFLQRNSWINTLKLRASYGSTGNSRIGSYAAFGTYTVGLDDLEAYNGIPVSQPESAPNPDIGWERNYKSNLGLDFAFLDRFSITIDAYWDRITDILATVDTQPESGFAVVTANTSTMENKGIELQFNAQIIQNELFNWNTTLNYSMNRNEIVGFNDNITANANVRSGSAYVLNRSSSTIYGLQYAGVDPATGDYLVYDNFGNIMSYGTYRDTYTTDLANLQILGDTNPDFFGSLINTFRVYHFTLSAKLDYEWGGERFAGLIYEQDGFTLQNVNQSVNLLDRWQNPGDDTYVSRLSNNKPVPTLGSSGPRTSRNLYDASYIKLQNVSLTYAFSTDWARRVGFKGMQLALSATNIWYSYREKSPEGRNGIKEYRFQTPERFNITTTLKVNF